MIRVLVPGFESYSMLGLFSGDELREEYLGKVRYLIEQKILGEIERAKEMGENEGVASRIVTDVDNYDLAYVLQGLLESLEIREVKGEFCIDYVVLFSGSNIDGIEYDKLARILEYGNFSNAARGMIRDIIKKVFVELDIEFSNRIGDGDGERV